MHNVEYYRYDENIDKKEIEAEINNYVSAECWREGGHGLPKKINWINHICTDEEEAERYIEQKDNNSYDQLAVKFREYENLEESKKYKELISRKIDIRKRLNSTRDKIHYKDIKSLFVSCKYCGSKLSTKYISSNYCPLCRKDLRPNSVLEKIQNYEKQLEELEVKLREEEKKLKKKQEKSATIKWLVKIEYHT